MASMWTRCARTLPAKGKMTMPKAGPGKALRWKVVCVLQNRDYATGSAVPNVMSAWQIHKYGDISRLQLSDSAKVPPLVKPNNVLVQIKAASINPIDVQMLGGYGASTLQAMRTASGTLQRNSEFPLILGRDFSGVVIKTGKSVPPTHFKPGDEVYGAGNAVRQGTHATYTVVNAPEMAKKPKNVSHVEAASIPYVAATTWSALCTVGGLHERNCHNKRVLVTGASGGIGTFAIQLLKIWGAEITATSSPGAADMMSALGADLVLDYTDPKFKTNLENVSGFDFVYDTIGSFESDEALKILNKNKNSKYITIRTPLLRNNDEHGVLLGLAKSALTFGQDTLKAFKGGQFYGWAVFIPNGRALQGVAKWVEQGKIKPVIESVYAFDDLKLGFERVAAGHLRGKIVIDMEAGI